MTNPKEWVKSRLTPAKRETPLWADLADAIQAVIETHVETYLDRLKRRVSLFDSHEDDQKVALSELGDFFALGDVESDDVALMVMQREDEIHQKRTIYPLTGTLNREFGGMDVSWEPLYAPIDQEKWPYGSRLVIESELEREPIPRDEWFLTSRGAIRVPLNDIYKVFGQEEAGLRKFESLVRRIIHPLIPLRIVCEGQQYYLKFDIAERAETLRIARSDACQEPHKRDEAEENADLTQSMVNNTFSIVGAVGDKPSGELYRMDVIPIDSFSADFNLQ